MTERRREERGTAPGTEAYWGRNRKWTNGGGLGDKESPDGVSSVRKKGTFNVQM